MRWSRLLLVVFISMLVTGICWAALEPATPDEEESWRINCGGSEFKDSSQYLWMNDEAFDYSLRWGYVNGAVGSTPDPIANTTEDTIYQWERFGGTDFSYGIDMPNGMYEVTLHFAELYWDAEGSRVFDVAIENTTVLDDLDIFTQAGHDTALSYSFITTVSDNNLDITFPEVKQDNAQICAVEVKVIHISEDDFLDFIQKKHFWFFWESGSSTSPVNAANGLIADRHNNWAGGWSPGAHDFCSTAVVGFGLTAICIAESRGWITYQEAYDRVLTTLKTYMYDIEEINGFFYHWLDMNTGQRWDSCELSSIDSGLFYMGALFAGQYFKGTEIETLADEIYRRVNWQWMTNGSVWDQQFVCMGWKPWNEGGFLNAWWNGYCESPIVDLLAIGSPTYPKDVACWTEMLRNWGTYAGYSMITAPCLFTHQYHHLWIDFRNKKYDEVDYFENSKKATLANRQFCIDNMGTYSTYGPKSWGLSAGDSPPPPDPPQNYAFYTSEPGGSYHNGTIVPVTVGGSVMFGIPETIETLKNFYFQYKHFLWGRYGFCNSYNVDRDWVSPDVIGIDQGAIFISIENYRTGMPWNTFMQIPYVTSALSEMGFNTNAFIVYDDFNGGSPPNNFGGGNGIMDPDPSDPAETISSTYDNAESKEGEYCLRLDYNRGTDSWVGFWSFLKDDQSGFNLEDYSINNIKLWAKGASGGETFKVELKDAADNQQAVSITDISGFESGVSTEYKEALIKLSRYTDIDFTQLKQLNIVFDTSPDQGTVYIDNIRFFTISGAATITVTVSQNLAVDVSGDIALGTIGFGNEVTSNNPVIVTNTGDVAERFFLSHISPPVWTPVQSIPLTPGINSYVLRALFNDTKPQDSDFSESEADIVKDYPVGASIVNYAGNQDGSNVDAGDVRLLWINFRSPNPSTVFDLQTIILVITASSP